MLEGLFPRRPWISAAGTFDERISVVSLLLSGLNEKFRNVIRMEELMSLRMEQMKKLQSGDAAAVKSGAAGRRCGAVSAGNCRDRCA